MTLEQDLKKREAELEKLKSAGRADLGNKTYLIYLTEKATEKELKKSLNILKSLKKKLMRLKQENGSAFEHEVDPIISGTYFTS